MSNQGQVKKPAYTERAQIAVFATITGSILAIFSLALWFVKDFQ